MPFPSDVSSPLLFQSFNISLVSSYLQNIYTKHIPQVAATIVNSAMLWTLLITRDFTHFHVREGPSSHIFFALDYSRASRGIVPHHTTNYRSVSHPLYPWALHILSAHMIGAMYSSSHRLTPSLGPDEGYDVSEECPLTSWEGDGKPPTGKEAERDGLRGWAGWKSAIGYLAAADSMRGFEKREERDWERHPFHNVSRS